MPFRHEALFYGTGDDFLAATVPFVREGVAGGEPVLVALCAERSELLARHLGDEAGAVEWADMAELGRNPARILPAWQAFVDRAGDRPARGIGEPAWPGRSRAELCECHRHEALLNLAFEDAAAFRLMCPYDAAGLSRETLEEARSTHPVVSEHGLPAASRAYLAPGRAPGPFAGDLAAPATAPEILPIAVEGLAGIRHLVGERAIRAGFGENRTTDLVIAVTELATNALRHGGGGTVALWEEEAALVCEVAAGGMLGDPFTGRTRPREGAIGGWGLWFVNHLCDLVQIRSGPEGTVVRVRMDLR